VDAAGLFLEHHRRGLRVRHYRRRLLFILLGLPQGNALTTSVRGLGGFGPAGFALNRVGLCLNRGLWLKRVMFAAFFCCFGRSGTATVVRSRSRSIFIFFINARTRRRVVEVTFCAIRRRASRHHRIRGGIVVSGDDLPAAWDYLNILTGARQPRFALSRAAVDAQVDNVVHVEAIFFN
jgi:hypothetical protein